MTSSMEAALEFGQLVQASTEKLLADYRAEHRHDPPAVVEAYCRGFTEATVLSAGVITAHILRPRR